MGSEVAGRRKTRTDHPPLPLLLMEVKRGVESVCGRQGIPPQRTLRPSERLGRRNSGTFPSQRRTVRPQKVEGRRKRWRRV